MGHHVGSHNEGRRQEKEKLHPSHLGILYERISPP